MFNDDEDEINLERFVDELERVLEEEMDQSYREMYSLLDKRGSNIFYSNGIIIAKTDPRPRLIEIQKYFEELEEYEKCLNLVKIISECDRIYKGNNFKNEALNRH